jgi:hypothetical protein
MTLLSPAPHHQELREQEVSKGLEFILNHFSQPLWPRMVSTAATGGRQHEVDNEERAMLYFRGALWEDCRISAYGLAQTNPDLIFIELDRSSFSSLRAFKLALTTTLKNIKERIGGHPTVIWSGRGYHIIQPISCPIPLEVIKEFEELDSNNTSSKFLQFAERYLSNNKSDSGHHPAIKSCMLRVPGSVNSKCKNEGGLDPEVRIIQKWDGHRPDYRLLIGSFYADLVGKKQQHPCQNSDKGSKYLEPFGSNRTTMIAWIEEKLLNTPIDDYRKRVRDLILVPYLVLRKGITDKDQVCDIVMEWADKCAELRRLDPSRREFERRIYSRIEDVSQERIPNMRLETMRERYPEMYEKIIFFFERGQGSV